MSKRKSLSSIADAHPLQRGPHRLVVLGKGGVGKSTFSSNLSAWYALQGMKVLHVGCDPKGDSSLILLKDIVNYRTVMTLLAQHKDEPSGIINEGRHGIDCIEVGGPESGVGCGGRGIARAIEFMEQARTIERGNYDVVIFDVLGDVVCGGFAAPMREGFGDKVVIVASEDEQSFYAANNISRAVVRYAVNCVGLAGIILNRGVAGEPGLQATDFARRINTTVIGSLPLCETMSQARLQRVTAVEYDPESPFSRAVADGARRILETDPATMPLPTPMDAVSFFTFATGAPATGQPDASFVEKEDGFAQPPETAVPLPEVLGERQGTLLAGPETVARFGEVLGVDKPALATVNLTLRSVQAREDGTIWLSLDSPVAGSVQAILKQPQSGPSFSSGTHLDVAYSATGLNPLSEQLLHHAARRFGRYRVPDLFKLIESDPGTTRALPQADKDAPDTDGAPAALQGFRGSPLALDHFRRLLAPGDPDAATMLDSVDAKEDGTLWLNLSGPAFPDESSIILGPAGSGGAYLQTPLLEIAYQGAQLTPELKHALEIVASSTGLSDLDVLRNIVLQDDARVPLSGAPDAAGAAQAKALDDWARFFADDQFRRNMFHAFTMDAPYVSVEHCDMECHYATPAIDDTLLDTFNYPWLSPGSGSRGQQQQKESRVDSYRTRLSEMDVVHGSAERLKTLMDGVIDNLDQQQLIMVNNACTPIVAGDDVESMLKGLSRTCPVPIMHLGPKAGMHPVLEFFKTVKNERGFTPRKPVAGSVNLVGFPEGEDTDEIIAGLATLGISLNVRPFPRIEMSLLDDYLSAALQVFCPNRYFDSLYKELFQDLPMAGISPAAPYGFEGNKRWYEAVANTLEVQSDWQGRLSKLEEQHSDDWRELVRKSRALVLGFVITPDSVERLTDENHGFGIPLARFLSETGFHIDVLALESDDSERIQEQVKAVFPPERVMFRTFGDPEELHQLIHGSPAQAFFSDFYFDHRLTGAGKSHFSLQFFQMGFAGAVRTLQRLIGACEVPFFARYGQYLGREQ